MSFEWNLSSDEEDNYENWTQKNDHSSSTVDDDERQQRHCFSLADTTSAGTEEEEEGVAQCSFVSHVHNNDDYYGDSQSEDERKPAAVEDSVTMSFPSDFDQLLKNDDSDDDDDEIDWEDAEEKEQFRNNAVNESKDRIASSLKAVTLDLSDKTTNDDSTANKKRKRRPAARTVFRHNDLPQDLQEFLDHIHRVHLMCLTSHALFASRYASDDESLHVAHSLIPSAWTLSTSSSSSSRNESSQCNSSRSDGTKTSPTIEDLKHFMQWFVQLTSGSKGRLTDMMSLDGRYKTKNKTAAKSKSRFKNNKIPKKRKNNNKDEGTCFDDNTNNPSQYEPYTIHYRILDYCSHLADQQECSRQRRNRQSRQNFGREEQQKRCTPYNEYDKILLFLSMARSMGWRARYVIAVQPIPKDLNVDHSIFAAMSHLNVFLGEWKTANYNRRAATMPIDLLDSDNENEQRSIQRKRSKLSPSDSSNAGKPDRVRRDDSTNKHLSALPSDLSLNNESSSPKLSCWLEVLCQRKILGNESSGDTTSARTSNHASMQWVHVDPSQSVLDDPNIVEQLLYANQHHIPVSHLFGSKRRQPIPYALAVEHLTMGREDGCHVRMTDVTRRYALSMVETLRARGTEQKQRRSCRNNDGNTEWLDDTLSKDWFGEFLREQTHRIGGRNKSATKKNISACTPLGKNISNVIVLDDDGDKKPAAVTPENLPGDINPIYRHSEIIDRNEEFELNESAQQEPLPTSKAAFKRHPFYVIPSVLNSTEVLVPDAKKRVCGSFKGEMVFLRKDVQTALPAKKWLYLGRKVTDSEVSRPVLKVKARKKPASTSFKALKSYGVGESNDGSEEARAKQIQDASQPLDDGRQHLYARWQTEVWSPSFVDPNDPIPANDYDNVELELLNPGLVHVDLDRIAKVARRLDIPYKPCLLGFEGHGGNRTPTIRGIVVHAHNEELLREAHAEMTNYFEQQEHESRQNSILRRWKRLLVGVLTKDRIDRSYGDDV